MTRYVEDLGNDALQCVLCPHHCRLTPGRTGVCGVRSNEAGALSLPFFAKVSALAMDPIEKKPLYHFHPKGHILSVGFLGCNLHCPFCQNFRISQNTVAATEELSPKKLVDVAVERGSFGIAYTYNEPVVHAEYVLEAAAGARKRGLKNVLVTAAYLEEQPARDIFSSMDAANIDLKGYDEGFYSREIGGRLDSVLRSIEIAYERCHLEVTTLVIPGRTDAPKQIEAICRFLAAIDPDIPLHLSAYYPTYHYSAPPTTRDLLLERARLAREQLRYVYTGNIASTSDTVCPHCGALLVSRKGYRVDVPNLGSSPTAAGNRAICEQCGKHVPIEV